MSKYDEIRQALYSIDQGTFQLICIDYLKQNVGGTIDSPGTTLSKNKTRKGHPDIYIVQKDGNYVFAECTTREPDSDRKAFHQKLEADLLACLDFKKLKISKDKISSIYLCTNSSFEPGEREALKVHTDPFGIHLELVGLFEISDHLSSSGKLAAKDILGIGYSTGQIMTKEQFLTRYQNKNLSTPLDNPIVGRLSALKELTETLARENIILLSGDPGVGKTRLAIEAISSFADTNPSYAALFIMSRSGEITEDLETFIKPNKNYILLVDDANRQLDNLTRLLDKLVDSNAQIKVVMTVREYAKKDLIRHLGDQNPCGLELKKLGDEDIKEIVTGEPFALGSSPIIERIIKVSRGNPRLAIMAADTMKNNPSIEMLTDVSRIYDSYFKSIFVDKPLFEDSLTRKVMGLVSFFYTIDLTDVQDYQIIKGFGIDIGEFTTRAQELEETEMIEVFKGTIRISEQIMATYFFYDSFFRNPVLDFNHLINKHFEKYPYRFKDSILGAVDAFGADKVIGLKKQILLEYWETRKTNRSFALIFLRFFSRYFPETTFVWLDGYINALPDGSGETDQPSEKLHISLGPIDEEILGLLETFYGWSGPDFKTAVHLSLLYVGKWNIIQDKLIEKLAGAVFMSKDEIGKGLPRLNFVYDAIRDMGQSDSIFQRIFFKLMDRGILGACGRHELYEKNGTRHVLKTIISQNRIKFLKDLETETLLNPALGYNLLLDYATEKRSLQYPEIENDFFQIHHIITSQFGNNSFTNSYLVDRYTSLVKKRTDLFGTQIELLRQPFQTPTLLLYKLLSMNQRDRTDYLSYEEFHAKKSQLIEKKIPICTLEEFKALHVQLVEITGFEKTKTDIGDGLSILFRKLLTDDLDLGFECLQYYLSEGNKARLLAGSIYAPIFQRTKKESGALYRIISAYDYPDKHEWQIRFFHFLPPELFDRFTITDLFECLSKHKGILDLYYSHYEKFDKIRKGTLTRILRLMVNRRKADNNFLYKLSYSFFRDSLANLDINLSLCATAYFQQEQIQGNYDVDCKELFLLISKDRRIFKRFLNHEVRTKERLILSGDLSLGRLWKLDFSEQLIYDTVLRISKLKSYQKSEHCGCAFLYGIDKLDHEKAYDVFARLVKDRPADLRLINTVLDILRNANKSFYHSILQLLVSQNHSTDFFSSLELHNNHFDYSTAGNWPEHKIKELVEIKDAIISMPDSYKYYAIKSHLDSAIAKQRMYSEQEMKYRFRGFW